MTLLTHVLPRRAAFCGAVALAACLGVAQASAQDQSGTNADAQAATTPGAVSVIDAAVALGEFGRAQEDPTILLGAARTLLLVGESEPDGEVVEDGAVADADKPGDASASAKADEDGDESLAAALISDARLYARGDETLLARADAIEGGASKGSTSGPGRYNRRIDSRSYLTIREAFRGGQTAEVVVVGDGDTDLDLRITDENGNTVCNRTSGGDRERCVWTPAWTGRFTIKVTNYGYVYNAARIYTN